MPILSGFFAISGLPAMGIAHLDHGAEDIVPGFLLHHYAIRKHAAIPTDMTKRCGNSPILAAQPHAGMAWDIEFAIGVGHHAVPSRLVMITHAFDGSIVLRHVEIDSPGPQHVGHFDESL